jgi:excisionase family DNA binding protein
MPVRRNQSNHTASVGHTALAPRCLGVKEAALYLGATVWAIRSLAWEGKVPFIRLGQRLLFDRQDLDKFIERTRVPARP